MKIITNKNISMYDFFELCKQLSFRTKFIKLLKKITWKEYYIKFPETSYKNAKKTLFYINIKKKPASLQRALERMFLIYDYDLKKCQILTESYGFLSKKNRSYIIAPCPHVHRHIDSIHSHLEELGDTFFDYFHKNQNKSFQLITFSHNDVHWLYSKFIFV